MALNVTVQSYNGRLDYGLIACRRALPDVNDLGDALLAEHRTLLELAQAKMPASVRIEAPVVEVPTLAAKAPARKRTRRIAVTA
jgi:hypothetical protein